MNYSTKPVKTNKTKARFSNETQHNRRTSDKTLKMSRKQARRNKAVTMSYSV